MQRKFRNLREIENCIFLAVAMVLIINDNLENVGTREGKRVFYNLKFATVDVNKLADFTQQVRTLFRVTI